MSIEMIVTLILALVTILITLHAKEVIRMKNQEIAKLERLRGNDAWEIDFMEWNIARLKRSEGRAVEEYQKLSGTKIYCVVRVRDNEITVSVGHLVGYRYELLPLGFIIDINACMITDKMTGDITIYE